MVYAITCLHQNFSAQTLKKKFIYEAEYKLRVFLTLTCFAFQRLSSSPKSKILLSVLAAQVLTVMK